VRGQDEEKQFLLFHAFGINPTSNNRRPAPSPSPRAAAFLRYFH
jgi:hypothetical protein